MGKGEEYGEQSKIWTRIIVSVVELKAKGEGKRNIPHDIGIIGFATSSTDTLQYIRQNNRKSEYVPLQAILAARQILTVGETYETLKRN